MRETRFFAYSFSGTVTSLHKSHDLEVRPSYLDDYQSH